MKKIIFIFLGGFSLSFFICYLLGAFYSTTFNIALWSEGCRGNVSILGGIIGCIAGFMSIMYDKMELG